MRLPWFRNTDGKPDAMLSFSVVAMATVIVKVLVGGTVIMLSESRTLTFGGIDAAVIAALLTPTLGSYIARKYTDKKLDASADTALPSDPAEREMT